MRQFEKHRFANIGEWFKTTDFQSNSVKIYNYLQEGRREASYKTSQYITLIVCFLFLSNKRRNSWTDLAQHL